MPTDLPTAARAPRLAVLIDGENASARIAEALFTEIATLGEASARRIYGDAASPALRGWIDVLPRWAIQWQQNFQNTKGKNSGDIALVIDAMLATGGSMIATVDLLKKKGCQSIKVLVLVAAPEGIKALEAAHPDVELYCAAVDQGLNEKGYIVPGLGDAGDRIFGTK